VGSNAVVVRDVPARCTAVGIPARIVEPGRDGERQRAAEKLGFSAYGISSDMNDPMVKAIHGLLDHVVNIDARIEEILGRLEQAGIQLNPGEVEKDGFDPNYLNRIVD
jgi:serine O-acetyltransferase